VISGIYKIINNKNGHFYIGSSSNLEYRRKEHLKRLKSNKHHSRYLQNAWNKYGKECFDFEIIEECENDKLLELEQFYLDKLKPEYNICKFSTSRLGCKSSDETRKKLSILNTGKNHPKFGTHHSLETRQKISASKIGKLRSDELKEKLSLYHKKNGSFCGTKNPKVKLNIEIVKNIRELYSDSFSIRDLSIKFNVNFSTIERIVKRKTWKHIE